MGLIYNPSESGELVSNFQANLTSCEQVIADLKKGNNHLIGILNSKQLGGAAFNSGLAMFSQLVIPTVNKVDTSIQDIKKKLQQFSQYTAAAGGEILDEDKLNQQLEELRRQQATLTSQIHVYQNQARINDDPDMTAMCYSYASDLSNFMTTVQDDIRKVEEKLKKLHELDMKTSSLFSEAQNEIQNLSTAILAINSVNFDSSGNFSMKCSKTDLAKINKFLSDKESKSKSKKKKKNNKNIEKDLDISDLDVGFKAHAGKESKGDKRNGVSVTAMEIEGEAGITIGGKTKKKKGKDRTLSSGVGAEAKVGVTAAEAEGHGQVGYDNTNVHGAVRGSSHSAEAHANAGIGAFTNENGKPEFGLQADAGASAYVIEGEAKAGFTLFGIKVDVSGSAGVGVAAEAKAGVTTQKAEAKFKLGPFGLGISIDASGMFGELFK
ncbi:hypothetical protein FACS1894192_11390 [Bacilli bacterium]|nr:hypothetical protein FACS1894192_11390 [Bacilli bacterium]